MVFDLFSFYPKLLSEKKGKKLRINTRERERERRRI